MLVSEYVDNRINKLEQLRKQELLNEELLKDNPFESSQRWARINELKMLKDKFTNKEGVWLI
jgi:hypothetical protein